MNPLFFLSLSLLASVALAQLRVETSIRDKARGRLLTQRDLQLELEGIQIRPDLQEMLEKLSPNRELILTTLENVINGVTEPCEPTVIGDYINIIIDGLYAEELSALADLISMNSKLDMWPIFYVLLSGRNPTAYSQDFYPDKQQGAEFAKRFSDLQSFWDTHPDNIALFPLTMKVVMDDSLIVPAVAWGFGMDMATAQNWVDLVQGTFELFPAIGYEFPLWTLNAIAFPFENDAPAGPGIAMGDGFMQYLETVGYGDAGPDMVLFHEFAHQVQYGNNVLFYNTAESTRYTELMADALAAYYGHHPRGASFQTKRIQEIIESSYAVGDCNVAVVGHHGTPNQRARAVEFATKLIDQSKKKGQILPSLEFIAKFNAAYNGILNG